MATLLLIRKITLVVLVLLPTLLLPLMGRAGIDPKTDSLYIRLQKTPSAKEKVRLLDRLSDEYLYQDISFSLECALKAGAIARAGQFDSLMPGIYQHTGNAYFVAGLYPEAVEAYEMAIQWYRKYNREVGLAAILTNMGGLQLGLGDYAGAIVTLTEALEQYMNYLNKSEGEIKPTEIPLVIYNNLGIAANNMEDEEAALVYYYKGLEMAYISPKGSLQLGNLFANMGSLYLSMGRVDEAYEPMMEALKIREESDDRAGMAKSYRSLSVYYDSIGRMDKKLEMLYKGLQLSAQYGFTGPQDDISQYLYAYYLKYGPADSAIKYLKWVRTNYNHMAFESSVAAADQMLLKRKLENIEKEALESSSKLKYHWLYALGLLTLLVLVIMVYLANMRQRLRFLEKENQRNKREIEYESLKLAASKSQGEEQVELLYNRLKQREQQQQLILEIRNQLDAQMNRLDVKQQDLLEGILRRLDAINSQEMMEELDVLLKDVSPDFYSRLAEEHPDLSNNEIRLSAFLVLGMDVDRISAVNQKSEESIHVALTRLRKKLSVTGDVRQLQEYLVKINRKKS